MIDVAGEFPRQIYCFQIVNVRYMVNNHYADQEETVMSVFAQELSPSHSKTNGRFRSTCNDITIMEYIRQNPSITLDELISRLNKNDYYPSKFAVSVIKSNFLKAMRLLQSKGNLKGIELHAKDSC